MSVCIFVKQIAVLVSAYRFHETLGNSQPEAEGPDTAGFVWQSLLQPSQGQSSDHDQPRARYGTIPAQTVADDDMWTQSLEATSLSRPPSGALQLSSRCQMKCCFRRLYRSVTTLVIICGRSLTTCTMSSNRLVLTSWHCLRTWKCALWPFESIWTRRKMLSEGPCFPSRSLAHFSA